MTICMDSGIKQYQVYSTWWIVQVYDERYQRKRFCTEEILQKGKKYWDTKVYTLHVGKNTISENMHENEIA